MYITEHVSVGLVLQADSVISVWICTTTSHPLAVQVWFGSVRRLPPKRGKNKFVTGFHICMWMYTCLVFRGVQKS